MTTTAFHRWHSSASSASSSRPKTLPVGSLLLISRAFNASRPDGLERRALHREVVEGLRFVLGQPVPRTISAMMALTNLLGNNLYGQLVVFAKRQLDASDSRVALSYSAGSAGVVLPSLAAGPVWRRLSFSMAALGALAVYGLLTIVLAVTRWYWVALPLWGGSSAAWASSSTSHRQPAPADRAQSPARPVVSIASVLAWSATPTGHRTSWSSWPT